ncbi:MAG TPA: helix-turn-helix transcriptional regulator [Spirochaetota bacterium]|nr:helix-turn-helix transcriptional regulator [Spirochaetota bacterium]HOF13512.1 helix-turn-helix transcriptional regulator [Spirochaetota bacterium]HOR94020.1 helix-turn-helix transcriptional regulator [Spirochaetota bacterium]HOT19451.1 helix-turn-helix transcriptional regulator [Spirochaetota bacterium]HPD05121.1 helix-turn-helix transcriptional regulator [Spirochaetota bacterium]
MAFKKIGKKIQIAREEKGITQIELSKMLGITQAALSNYELGKRRLYLQQIEEIAKHLEKPVSYFLDEESSSNIDDELSDITINSITDKIKNLTHYEINELNQFIDYLLWRRNHE